MTLSQWFDAWVAGQTSVTARWDIEQCPLSDAPMVPFGYTGTIEDIADGYLWVDFGGPYGVVCCDALELR